MRTSVKNGKKASKRKVMSKYKGRATLSLLESVKASRKRTQNDRSLHERRANSSPKSARNDPKREEMATGGKPPNRKSAPARLEWKNADSNGCDWKPFGPPLLTQYFGRERSGNIIENKALHFSGEKRSRNIFENKALQFSEDSLMPPAAPRNHEKLCHSERSEESRSASGVSRENHQGEIPRSARNDRTFQRREGESCRKDVCLAPSRTCRRPGSLIANRSPTRPNELHPTGRVDILNPAMCFNESDQRNHHDQSKPF